MSQQWSALRSSEEAICAILTNGASRRPQSLGPGEGFKTLFKNITDSSGVAELRSGDSTALVQTENGTRVGTFIPTAPFPGLQVSIRLFQIREHLRPSDFLTSGLLRQINL